MDKRAHPAASRRIWTVQRTGCEACIPPTLDEHASAIRYFLAALRGRVGVPVNLLRFETFLRVEVCDGRRWVTASSGATRQGQAGVVLWHRRFQTGAGGAACRDRVWRGRQGRPELLRTGSPIATIGNLADFTHGQ
jgi:hypothetical protein